MKIKKFYQHLDKLQKLHWSAKVTETGWILLREPGGGRFAFTPMTAVCFVVKEEQFHWLEDTAAGTMLGLPKATVTILHKASFGKSEFRLAAIYRHLNICAYEKR